MIQKIVETVRFLARDLLEICSRAGLFTFANITVVNSSHLSIFPAGDYRNTLKFYDSFNDNIINVTITQSIQR